MVKAAYHACQGKVYKIVMSRQNSYLYRAFAENYVNHWETFRAVGNTEYHTLRILMRRICRENLRPEEMYRYGK